VRLRDLAGLRFPVWILSVKMILDLNREAWVRALREVSSTSLAQR
jgi:hypothetical protein